MALPSSFTDDPTQVTQANMNEIKDALVDGTLEINPAGLRIGGTIITSSAAELNILDGVTATAAELNILDGVTATATELNVLDGIPATLTATELGYVDGVTSAIQTQLDAKLPLAGGTMTGDLDAGGFDVKDISLGTFKFYDAGNSGTSKTIAWNDGAMQKLTLTGNLGTFTFTAPTLDSGNWARLMLYIVQGAGPYTITWPSSVKFPGGTAPTLNTTSGNVDIVTFIYDGTNYAAVASINHDM